MDPLVILSLVLVILIQIYFALKWRFSYWERCGVVHVKPALFFGNLREVGRTKALYEPFREFYLKFKGRARFGGFYLSLRRAVILLDLDLVKQVLIKDFANFSQRGNYYNEKDDPLSAHLFNLDGPKWRSMRNKLSPTFTSGKMKFMLPTIVEVGERFVAVLGELVEKVNAESPDKGIEMKELLARFTTDVIGNCAFGLECNSLRDPETQFRIMGKRAFSKRRHGRLIFSIITAFPNLARKMGVKMVPNEINDFFLRVVRETVEYRERENIQRNDFLNLLIELKNKGETEGLTIEEIAAQAFVFFLAGFETSSSTMAFVLYELAVNQDIQDKARAEVNAMFDLYDGTLTYEGMHGLKYLQQILHETMRRYSIASFIMRKTVEDYAIPGESHVIEKGTIVIVPVDGIHHDPDLYPDPEVFDPERFAPGEAEKRHSMAWLPFGEGPRNCIGLRFGELQAIVGLAMLLRNFRFTPTEDTKIPIKIDIKNFLLAPVGGVTLNMERL